MFAVLFIGIQGSGKSTFFSHKFFQTHIRINLDMLRTRHREKLFLDTCLQAKQSFVIDNTNPTKVDRQRYITHAKEHGFEVVGYYFQSKIEDCLQRNQSRLKGEKVPIAGVKATHAKLELPCYEEGFDKLYYVEPDNNGAFAVQEWNDEV